LEKEEVERGVGKLLYVREVLERRVAECGEELKLLRFLLKLVEERLTEEVFKAAAETSKSPSEARQTMPLKTTDGTLLATIYVENELMRIIPSENIKFNVNTPPLQSFLVGRILDGMASKDREEAEAGKISPDEILTYKILRDGDTLKEIVVKGLREERRVTALKRSIRWTLEKMYEKMKT